MADETRDRSKTLRLKSDPGNVHRPYENTGRRHGPTGKEVRTFEPKQPVPYTGSNSSDQHQREQPRLDGDPWRSNSTNPNRTFRGERGGQPKRFERPARNGRPPRRQDDFDFSTVPPFDFSYHDERLDLLHADGPSLGAFIAKHNAWIDDTERKALASASHTKWLEDTPVYRDFVEMEAVIGAQNDAATAANLIEWDRRLNRMPSLFKLKA